MVVYLIATIEKMARNRMGNPDFGDIRTVAYYTDKESAEKAVRENTCDIHEGRYDFAVIEAVEEGLYPVIRKRQFFKFNKETEEYEKTEEPEVTEHISNFTIG